MKIQKAYRYEMKPNVLKRIGLAQHTGTARFAFNWGLSLTIEQYKIDGTFLDSKKLHKILNSKKDKEFPWMYEVSKCAPQEALRDLERSFKNFFKACKTGAQCGFPQFKRKNANESFRLTGTIKIVDRSVQLPRLGLIRLKEKPRVQGRILSATVTRDADRWYVSLTCEVEIEDPQPVIGDTVALDLGLESFITFSTGEKLFAPKPLNSALKRLKRRSKQHSRKTKGSKNKKKSALKLARLHRKVRNVRKDFLHKISTKLTKTKSVIVIEDLDVKGLLQKRGYARHIADAGWGEFRRQLEYKAKWYGSRLHIAPRYFASSKICSSCTKKMDILPLSIREWTCPHCQAVHDRDINAAKNLLKWSTESSSGIDACGDSSDSGTVNNWSTSYESKKQEITNEIFVHKL